ncbi:hypothetical protein K493DRAFT_210083 [Basidiobolus meristosporus CBS 931.73]|uniref:Uncharacterized protein n=1 Tax=Basidiobolus meristosporus CBS 931.73 TaxID=1314790 RepID=A0A1Y1YSY0_9FUNG|nr:hypothetical protein K493DRAFT_210083 [Basidiobolus meristosporus CBS 931.73]|eukprot:ORY01138.1 hypothetical protein K493DRAFT_210083 [Basidiobolus meristosporus CBS 931.73]
MKSWFARKTQPFEKNKPILAQDDLFHPLSKSPIKEIEQRGLLINKYGVCPVCVEKHEHNHPVYECPDCGYPTHCCEEHYQQNKPEHEKVCKILRDANEDEHDLRSGRIMKEFEFPSGQPLDETINMANWDTFFYTRGFPSMDSDRSMRHTTKLLTYPITIGSILHPSSPYRPGDVLTNEGLKSLTALRNTMNIQQIGKKSKGPTETIRVFILGARAESQLPSHIYNQITYLFPETAFHLYFVGPEAVPPNMQAGTNNYSARLSLTYENAVYHEYFPQVAPFDPYTDIFFLFSPGLGQPDSRDLWKPSISKLLETKCPIFITSFDEQDMNADVQALKEDHVDDIDWLMKPTINHFRSLKYDINPEDVRVGINANWGIYAIRGKKYEVTHSD